MIYKLYRHILFTLPMAALVSTGTAYGATQPNDSLSLGSIISEVVENHPLVKKTIEELNVSDAKIGFAKSGYLPYVDLTSSYSRLGPVSEVTIPGMGTFGFVPKDNYSATINVNQTIYDFGKTTKSVSLEKQGKNVSQKLVEQTKQLLSQTAISSYFTLVYLQEALKIKEEQINTLKQHLQFVQKKQATGSATQYEILTTQVKISVIENQKTDLETAHQVQVCQLNLLLGKSEATLQVVKNDLSITMPELQGDSLIGRAMQNRDEMKMANEKAKMIQLRYNLTGAQNNPVLNAFLSGGIKNGYTPYLNDPKANFVAGINLRVPLYDGKRNKYNLIQAKSAIVENDQELEITRRNIVKEVVESQANVLASKKKVDQSELQLRQAIQAYDLAKVRFESGVITNIELLEMATAVSESHLTLLKSKIDYTVCLYKLKSAIGDRLY